MKQEYSRLIADVRRYLEQDRELEQVLLTTHQFSFTPAPMSEPLPICAPIFQQDIRVETKKPTVSDSIGMKGLKEVVGQIAPSLRVVEKVPSDEKAKKIAETWKEQQQIAEVTFLLLEEGPKERAFLQELAKAVNIALKPAKLLDGRRLEEEKKWDVFLKTSELKWIFVSSGLPQWPELLRYYKELPAVGRHFLGEKPLHFLAPISTYFKTPLLKHSLWQKLSSLL